MKGLEHCPECGVQESYPLKHKLSCGSKSVFDAYVILRDWDLRALTDEMISKLSFKLFVEEAERSDEREREHLRKLIEEEGE
jgi:hypothetical protein